jgi:O-antigen/teichoic acid export membrane protein
VAGRLLSGLLGMLWLALLVRALSPAQYGVYVAALALFELLQAASSAGAYAYAARYLPVAWLQASARSLATTLMALWAWRLLTLAVAAACVAGGWPWVQSMLDWPSPAPGAGVFITFLLANGCARLIEGVFDTALQQGWIQLLSTLRNAARIAALLACESPDAPFTAEWVIGLEAALAGLFVLAGSWRLWHLTASRPATSTGDANLPRGLQAFTAQGYASLLLAQLCGIDAVKLVLSHTAGPAALAVFGLAQSIAETVARYMPAGLLYGYARTVLTARADIAGAASGPLPAARLLLRVNGLFLGLVTAVLLTAGDILLHRLAPALFWPGLMGATLSLLLLLHAQALRLMASLMAQVRSDNRPILWANLATLPVPWVTAAMVSAWGLAGAVAGAGLLELTYTAVTLHAAGLAASALWGPRRFWLCMAGAVGVATLAGAALRWVDADERFWMLGVPLAAAIFSGFIWRLRALTTPEVQALRRLLPGRRAPAHVSSRP